MKIPDRIVGTLELNDSKAIFEFNKDSFELMIYPQIAYDDSERLWQCINSCAINLKEHVWTKNIVIKGETVERHTVLFGTTDIYSSYNGYPKYNIDWYYITDDASGAVDEIRFFGHDVDVFYNPAQIFQHLITCKNDKKNVVGSMSTTTNGPKVLDCGKYISGDVQIDVSCHVAANLNCQSPIPLASTSYMKLKCSDAVYVSALIDKIIVVKAFFMYVCYRTNIFFSDILTYITDENGNKRNCGKLVFNGEQVDECNEKAKERVIRAEYLCEHVAEILQSIDTKEMSFEHVCASINEMSYYTISRIMMIFTAFEREFRNIYGQDVRRSNEYKITKTEVVKLIEDYAKNVNGKQKRYAKDIAKGIESHDSSYKDNFQFALQDCRSIIEPFVMKYFKGSYEEIIDEVSSKINRLRNDIAHSRLNMEFKARYLADIKLVEEMIYVIRLKKIGIKDLFIQKSINELFNENMVL